MQARTVAIIPDKTYFYLRNVSEIDLNGFQWICAERDAAERPIVICPAFRRRSVTVIADDSIEGTCARGRLQDGVVPQGHVVEITEAENVQTQAVVSRDFRPRENAIRLVDPKVELMAQDTRCVLRPYLRKFGDSLTKLVKTGRLKSWDGHQFLDDTRELVVVGENQ